VLVTALATDPAGIDLADLLARAGVRIVDLGLDGRTCEKIRLRADGVSLARWDRGERTTPDQVGVWTAEAGAALADADAVLVSCYGRGLSARDDARAAIATATVPVVWDPHPHGAAPLPGTAVATPNDGEVRRQVPEAGGDGLDAITRRAEVLLDRWQVAGLAVTRGSRGALFTRGEGLPLTVPSPAVASGDPCGAGDRFAATLTAALAAGALAPEAVTAAVHAASRFVVSGGAAGIDLTDTAPDARRDDDDPVALAERVRANGGTVIATGGCFDLVHAGHVHVLEAARALGDCLVVCLNSDASVRRLKGPDRPIVPAADRAELLRALACVDGVVVFDEDTPAEALRRLRPHVFAKGGDYGTTRIPEADVVAAWDGQAVTLPYLEGRSTTRILEEVQQRVS
jgi:D-beta-D-heptose 7-phosphate kinase/D-beta-D-heptose 1-phosphate adenosyltransferase